MKVVYLNPSGQLGGAEWSLLHLLAGLCRERAGFAPHVVCTEAGPLMEYCSEAGVSAEVLPLPQKLEQIGDAPGQSRKAHGPEWGAYARSSFDMAKYVLRLKSVLKRERPRLIHTNGFKMHLLGAWARQLDGGLRQIPLVGHIHDYVSRRPSAGRLLRLTSPQFSHFIANSESVASDIRASLHSTRVTTVYNAIDCGRFSPAGTVLDLDRLAQLPPASPDTIRVGLVATFARWKGQLTFLKALAQIDPALPIRGYVIGGPIYKTSGSQFSLDELQQEAARLGLEGRAGFTGFVPDTAAALRALDIAVHASTAPEPFGMAIIEAMACQKAVIVSELGGATELFVDGVTALGHAPGDSALLANRILRLANDRRLRDSLGRNARQSVLARFDPRSMAQSVSAVYERAASLRSPGRHGKDRAA